MSSTSGPLKPQIMIFLVTTIIFIYLFGVLRRFQHCTGHITTGSWKGRGNQYIQFVRVLYCKLPTNGKQLPAFPLECYHSATVAPQNHYKTRAKYCLHLNFIHNNQVLHTIKKQALLQVAAAWPYSNHTKLQTSLLITCKYK